MEFPFLPADDQHFIDPFAAGILCCTRKAGHNGNTVDLAPGFVLIYQHNASWSYASVIKIQQAFYNRLGLFSVVMTSRERPLFSPLLRFFRNVFHRTRIR